MYGEETEILISGRIGTIGRIVKGLEPGSLWSGGFRSPEHSTFHTCSSSWGPRLLCTLFIMFLSYAVFLLCNIVWICQLPSEFIYFLLNPNALVTVARDSLNLAGNFRLVRSVLQMEVRSWNHCAMPLQLTSSYHSGLISQSGTQTDPWIWWEGCFRSQASDSASLLRKSEVGLCEFEISLFLKSLWKAVACSSCIIVMEDRFAKHREPLPL